MTPVGTYSCLSSHILSPTIGFLDTYTAQATVGDVNKGITNHKVIFSRDVVKEQDLTLRA